MKIYSTFLEIIDYFVDVESIIQNTHTTKEYIGKMTSLSFSSFELFIFHYSRVVFETTPKNINKSLE